MKNLLKLEEFGQFLLSIFLFNQLEYQWWVYISCILLPDISMFGYLINPKIGAWLYNLAHHKLIAIIFFISGYCINSSLITLIGIILLGHSAMDRIFGYGLKFKDDFKRTHLGIIGKNNN